MKAPSWPKLYLNQRQADQLLKAFPGLEGSIEVLDTTLVLEKLEFLERVNQKRSEPEFKPNRKMRRQK